MFIGGIIMQDTFDDRILQLCNEMKPSYMLTVGNDNINFIDELFRLCQDNEIFLNVVNPSENINIDNFKEKYKFDLIKFKSFKKFLMLNMNNLILINGNFNFKNLHDELKYILQEYSPKEFPFIIFYNTLNNFQQNIILDNNFQKLKLHCDNEISEHLKNFILETNMDLFFYSTFLFNGLCILCSNSKKNRKLIRDNFIEFLGIDFEDNLNKFICFETKNINNSFNHETLFINTQNLYEDDFSKENIRDIIQREVVLTESKKELYDMLVQKDNMIDTLNQNLEDIIQREVVLTESKKELYDMLVQKDNIINELNCSINKLHNNIVQRETIINNLNNVLQDNKHLINKLNDSQDKLNDILIQKDNIINELNCSINKLHNNIVQRETIINNLNNVLQDNKHLINKLNDSQDKLNDILIQKDTIIDDLNNQLSEVKEDDLKINKLNKDIRYELIEKENSIKKLEMSNKKIQNILIQNKHTFKKLEDMNKIYESSNSWKITAPLRKIKRLLK